MNWHINMTGRVISPSRPVGAEATVGKNPTNHIGKIFNILSFKIANEIHSEVSGLDEVCVWYMIHKEIKLMR